MYTIRIPFNHNLSSTSYAEAIAKIETFIKENLMKTRGIKAHYNVLNNFKTLELVLPDVNSIPGKDSKDYSLSLRYEVIHFLLLLNSDNSEDDIKEILENDNEVDYSQFIDKSE